MDLADDKYFDGWETLVEDEWPVEVFNETEDDEEDGGEDMDNVLEDELEDEDDDIKVLIF